MLETSGRSAIVPGLAYPGTAMIKQQILKQGSSRQEGIGLRLDFSYLIFRLDLATPFRKPWYVNEVKNVSDEGVMEYKKSLGIQ